MTKDKENAFSDYMDMITKSWTWARMTSDEQRRCDEVLHETHLFGTYKQRRELLRAVYHGFLMALDYKPIGWRETDPEAPLW